MKSFLNLTFLSDFLLGEIISKPISFSERVAKSSVYMTCKHKPLGTELGGFFTFCFTLFFLPIILESKIYVLLKQKKIEKFSRHSRFTSYEIYMVVFYSDLFSYLVLFTLFQVF